MDNSKMAMMRTSQTSLMLASCVHAVAQTAEEEESNNQIFSGLNEIFSRTGQQTDFQPGSCWVTVERSAATHILILFSTPNVGALLIPAPAACTQAATTFMVT